MKSILATDPNNTAAFVARMTLAIVVFPHGAQKLFGWFGGYGFTNTLNYLTGGPNLPWIIALLVILIESIGALLIFVGYATRIAAVCTFGNFLGVMWHSHLDQGFFMNWRREPDTSEGFEFFLLILGLSIILFITGGGRWSVDAEIMKRRAVARENIDTDITYDT